MNYKVIGYDDNSEIVDEIVHTYEFNDFTKSTRHPWLTDFYQRYIHPLDGNTEKRNDREIILKNTIKGIKRIIAQNLD